MVHLRLYNTIDLPNYLNNFGFNSLYTLILFALTKIRLKI